jgi:Domain of unknown function (DUF4190)
MKRCPTCNRTFDEEWLAFCTQDGTTLIEEGSSKSNEPPATILAPPPPPPPGNWQQPSGGLGSGQFQSQPIPPPPSPSNIGAPSGGIGSGQFQPGQQMQSGWQPPPPPTVQGQTQGLAVASMICGIFSVTIGWCCYLGVLSAPVAIGLGIYQLMQIKKDPEHNTGKPFAMTGVIAGAVYFVGLAIFILVYGVALLAGGLGK